MRWSSVAAAPIGAALVLGTFLPWREHGGGSDDGWRTAGLAADLAGPLDQPVLRAAAIVLPFMVACGAGAALLLALRPERYLLHLCRGLSATAAGCAASLLWLLSAQAAVHVSPVGPAVAAGSCFVLLAACWSQSRTPSPFADSGDVHT